MQRLEDLRSRMMVVDNKLFILRVLRSPHDACLSRSSAAGGFEKLQLAMDTLSSFSLRLT